jgi:hypothetical protein
VTDRAKANTTKQGLAAQSAQRDRAARVALFRAHLREFFRALEEAIIDRGWDMSSSSVAQGRVSLIITSPKNTPAAAVSAVGDGPEARVGGDARACADIEGRPL